MVDTLTTKKRSWNMSRIKASETKPEIRVRSALHRAGLRFRKNVKGLPGKPDIVMRKHSLIVFVHGCFWHQHEGCKDGGLPKSRVEFWAEKLGKNVDRDVMSLAALEKLGWKVVVIWECETEKDELLQRVLQQKVFSNISRNLGS